MKQQDKPQLIIALDTISEDTDVPVKELIDLLTGHCWDEEDAGELREKYEGYQEFQRQLIKKYD